MEFSRRARCICQEVVVDRCCVGMKTPVAVHGRDSMMVACQMDVPAVGMLTKMNMASPASVAKSDVMVVAVQVG